MATTVEMQERIAALARELAEEWGEVDDSNALSWLDAIETRAVEIGDAAHPGKPITSATKPRRSFTFFCWASLGFSISCTRW